MVYLFIGEDSLSKDTKLARIKSEFLPQKLEKFNFDTLYAKELQLKSLQEQLAALPLEAAKRVVVIKDAQNLKENLQEFILQYTKKPYPKIVLILDITQRSVRNEFISKLSKNAQVCRFRENPYVDSFMLSRQIELRRPEAALKILHQLLVDGEKPERILGGLRYSWEKAVASPIEKKNKLKALLNCDIEIKTGRLKPEFALEKLVVGLCGFVKPLR